jgi:hypothetical protein
MDEALLATGVQAAPQITAALRQHLVALPRVRESLTV